MKLTESRLKQYIREEFDSLGPLLTEAEESTQKIKQAVNKAEKLNLELEKYLDAGPQKGTIEIQDHRRMIDHISDNLSVIFTVFKNAADYIVSHDPYDPSVEVSARIRGRERLDKLEDKLAPRKNKE